MGERGRVLACQLWAKRERQVGETTFNLAKHIGGQIAEARGGQVGEFVAGIVALGMELGPGGQGTGARGVGVGEAALQLIVHVSRQLSKLLLAEACEFFTRTGPSRAIG